MLINEHDQWFSCTDKSWEFCLCYLPFNFQLTYQPESGINSHRIMNYVTTLLINLKFKTTTFFCQFVCVCVCNSIKNCSHVIQLYPCTGPCCFCIQQNDLQERELRQLASMHVSVFLLPHRHTQHLFNKFKSCTSLFSTKCQNVPFLHNRKCLVIYGIQNFNPIKY